MEEHRACIYIVRPFGVARVVTSVVVGVGLGQPVRLTVCLCCCRMCMCVCVCIKRGMKRAIECAMQMVVKVVSCSRRWITVHSREERWV